MKTRWLAYAVALSALMLFGYACKKGGGSGVTYLTVLQVSPLKTRAPMSRSKPAVGFQVDAPIDAATLSTDTFFVTDPQGSKMVGELALDEDDPSVVVFKPDEPLEVITTFTATITTELAAYGWSDSRRGLRMGVQDPRREWGLSEWIESTGTGRSDDQRIVVDAESNAIAVWEFTNELTGSNPPTGIWSSPLHASRPLGSARTDRRRRRRLAQAVLGGRCGGQRVLRLGGREERRKSGIHHLDESVRGRCRAGVRRNAFRPACCLRSGQPSQPTPTATRSRFGSSWSFPATTAGRPRATLRARHGLGRERAIDTMPTRSVPAVVDVQDGRGPQRDRDLGRDAPGRRTAADGEVLWANRYVAGQGWETARPIKSDPETRSRERAPRASAKTARRTWSGSSTATRRPLRSSSGAKTSGASSMRRGSNWDSTDWGEPSAHRQRRRGRQARAGHRRGRDRASPMRSGRRTTTSSRTTSRTSTPTATRRGPAGAHP